MSERATDAEPRTVVVIGASAGGVEALVRVVCGLPAVRFAAMHRVAHRSGSPVSDSEAVEAERRGAA